MAAIFRARPWLLAPARSTPPPIFLVGAARPLAPTTGQARSYAKKLAPQIRVHKQHASRGNRDQQSTSTMVNDMVQKQQAVNPAEMATLSPGTIVSMSFSGAWNLLSSSPKKFFKYYFAVLKQKITDKFMIMQQSLQVRGGVFGKYRRSDFKPTREGVTEAAVVLHAIMSRCMAAGSPTHRAQLAKICTPKLYASLLAMIESRPPGKSYKWERLGLLGKPFWPRIKDYKWTEMPISPQEKINSRQAVVGIKSRQRLTRLNEKNEVMGTPKEMVLTEYLVLWRLVNTETQTLGPWLISGTLKETSFEDLQDELSTVNALTRLRAEDAIESKKKLQELRDGKSTAGTS